MMVAILSFASMMMREAMGDEEFWHVLRSGEVSHRSAVYSKESSFGYFAVCLEYPDIVTFEDWFGIGVDGGESHQYSARQQLLKKLGTGDYCSEENAISVVLTDKLYGDILVVFSPHPDDDEAFKVRFTAQG